MSFVSETSGFVIKKWRITKCRIYLHIFACFFFFSINFHSYSTKLLSRQSPWGFQYLMTIFRRIFIEVAKWRIQNLAIKENNFCFRFFRSRKILRIVGVIENNVLQKSCRISLFYFVGCVTCHFMRTFKKNSFLINCRSDTKKRGKNFHVLVKN